MPITDEAVTAPLSALAERLQRGELSPVELVEATLAQVERHNAEINAYVLVLAEQARAQARESEERIRRGQARALEGLPVAVKDNVDVSGTPTTQASHATSGRIAEHDAAVVARLRNAGAVLVGKTNLPEIGTLPSTENRRFGATRNPWDTTRTAGGSSGGGAAAVAAGMAAAAHGNDAGGSLRIPAACTGLFGLKPTRGRISSAPLGETPFGLNVEGFITRTVRDNALLLDVAAGAEIGDPYSAPAPARPFVEECDAAPGRLRIGWTLNPPIGVPVDAVYADAVQQAAALCEQLGHEVEEFTPPWHNDALFELFNAIWAAYFAAKVEAIVDDGGDPTRLEPLNQQLWEAGKQLNSGRYWRAAEQMQQVVREISRAEDAYDVVLTPGLAKPPLLLGEIWQGSENDVSAPILNAALFTPFTVPANLSGQPAALLPLYAHDGLPVGVQVMARYGDEATLLRLGSQLEQALPWADRHPALD